MPLVGTCSVAIAAACHAQEKESDEMASLPLQWGAVPDARIPETGVGHCCFSSEEVEMPKEGSAYAGMGGSGTSPPEQVFTKVEAASTKCR